MNKTNTHKTKNNMARTMVQYLGGYDKLPPKNHPEVKKLMKFKKEDLIESYKVSKEMIDFLR